jgi:hypothetical protein
LILLSFLSLLLYSPGFRQQVFAKCTWGGEGHLDFAPQRDATAAFSDDRMPAAHDLEGSTFAHVILTTANSSAHCQTHEKDSAITSAGGSTKMETS